MIRQSAFIGKRKMLRGNLHLHTNRSDGKYAPEEAMKIYAENGYDFVALTDHALYNKVNFALDTGMVVIPGIEVHTKNLEPGNGFRVYHSVWLGADNDYNGFVHDEKIDAACNREEFQKQLDDAHSKNNITIYCHPEWSWTPPRYFDKLKGLSAMEIWNTCSSVGDLDTNAAYWDDMLGQGHKLWGVAVDDAHELRHYCGGWIMVNAEKTVESILDAIKNGAFYSSCGPIIEDFYADGNKVYLRTAEESAKILINSDKQIYRIAENSSYIETKIQEDYKYVRATVVSKTGKRAWTNPIFLK